MKESYNGTVMDHFYNPRNVGEIDGPDAAATVRNPVCGDVIRLTLRIEEGRILKARVKTFGCAAAIASASVLTELLQDRTVPEATGLKNRDVVDALGGLPETKEQCSVLAEEVLATALHERT